MHGSLSLREPAASTSWWYTSRMRTQKSVLVAVVLSVSVLGRVQLIATHGSSVHGISPARVLESVATSSSRGS